MMAKRKSDIIAKQNKIKNLIKNDEQYGQVSVFAIAHGLEYASLCATISGRQPNVKCVRTLMNVYGLSVNDFPRVPSSMLKMPVSQKQGRTEVENV